MKKNTNRAAVIFVVLLGLVSLFSDMTYEGARSINGQFLELLGTNGFVVGIVAGIGELFGYGLRLISGYFADKTKRYWLITILGYTLNLFSVPILAWAGYWQLAVTFMIMERIGKALRSPAKDALLSFGAKQIGAGWGFGLQEALDQIGATLGPILVAAVLYFKNQNYQLAYFLLFIPAIIAISILFYAKYLYPNPENLEVKTKSLEIKGYNKYFWWYLSAVIFVAAGYADFPIIAYHIKLKHLVNDSAIPLIYSFAMISDAFAALILGKLYDKIGLKSLLIAILLSALFSPLIFLGNLNLIIIGMALWGIGMGAQESILRAFIAQIIPQNKRGTSYGTFNAVYGIFWFLGSSLIGLLYDKSLIALVLFSTITQIIGAIIIFMLSQSHFSKQIHN
jgi:MFS family permease